MSRVGCKVRISNREENISKYRNLLSSLKQWQLNGVAKLKDRTVSCAAIEGKLEGKRLIERQHTI